MRWLKRRLQESFGTVRGVVHNPWSLGGMARAAALRLWRARGGGFYGLGYVIAFVVLEVRSAADEVAGADGVTGFVTGQLAGFLLRFTIESFLNGFLALLWPLFVIDRLALWGAAMLGAGYFVFERWLRPLAEAALPELRKQSEGAPGGD